MKKRLFTEKVDMSDRKASDMEEKVSVFSKETSGAKKKRGKKSALKAKIAKKISSKHD